MSNLLQNFWFRVNSGSDQRISADLKGQVGSFKIPLRSWYGITADEASCGHFIYSHFPVPLVVIRRDPDRGWTGWAQVEGFQLVSREEQESQVSRWRQLSRLLCREMAERRLSAMSHCSYFLSIYGCFLDSLSLFFPTVYNHILFTAISCFFVVVFFVLLGSLHLFIVILCFLCPIFHFLCGHFGPSVVILWLFLVNMRYL